jgi:hypothetical protein
MPEDLDDLLQMITMGYVFNSLQLTVASKVSTPVNWKKSGAATSYPHQGRAAVTHRRCGQRHSGGLIEARITIEDDRRE